jgi:hypothetical protein
MPYLTAGPLFLFMKPFLFLQPEDLSPDKKPVLKSYKSPFLRIIIAMASRVIRATA